MNRVLRSVAILCIFFNWPAYAWVCSNVPKSNGEAEDRYIKIKFEEKDRTFYFRFFRCSFRAPDIITSSDPAKGCLPIGGHYSLEQIYRTILSHHAETVGDQIAVVASLAGIGYGFMIRREVVKVIMALRSSQPIVLSENLLPYLKEVLIDSKLIEPRTQLKLLGDSVLADGRIIGPDVLRGALKSFLFSPKFLSANFGSLGGSTVVVDNLIERKGKLSDRITSIIFGPSVEAEVVADRYLFSGSKCEYYPGSFTEYLGRLEKFLEPMPNATESDRTIKADEPDRRRESQPESKKLMGNLDH